MAGTFFLAIQGTFLLATGRSGHLPLPSRIARTSRFESFWSYVRALIWIGFADLGTQHLLGKSCAELSRIALSAHDVSPSLPTREFTVRDVSRI